MVIGLELLALAEAYQKVFELINWDWHIVEDWWMIGDIDFVDVEMCVGLEEWIERWKQWKEECSEYWIERERKAQTASVVRMPDRLQNTTKTLTCSGSVELFADTFIQSRTKTIGSPSRCSSIARVVVWSSDRRNPKCNACFTRYWLVGSSI